MSFLDLCAGSGAVGIEALSRGARHATFVDQSRTMCALVKSNLDLCKIDESEGAVVQSEAQEYLRNAIAQQPGASAFDIVFFDPPYANDYLPILESLGAHASSLFTANGLLIIEHHHKNELKDKVGSIIRSRVLKQGDSALSFYQQADRS